MANKKIVIPKLASPDPAEAIELSRAEIIETMRVHYEGETAQLRLAAAKLRERLAAHEIAELARGAANELTVATHRMQAAKDEQAAFARTLAERYGFELGTYTLCPQTATVRRIPED